MHPRSIELDLEYNINKHGIAAAQSFIDQGTSVKELNT